MKPFIKLSVICIAFISMFILLLKLQNIYLMPKGYSTIPISTPNTSSNILISLATLAGILSKAIYESIKKTDAKQFNIISTMSNLIRSKELYLSLLISPLVVLAIIYNANQFTDKFLTIMFCYQNGFFWNSVLHIKAGK